MESWRLVWRNGFAAVFSTEGLQALAEALRTDDPRLQQGSTTTPPPLMCVQDWPVEDACCIGFIGALERGGFASTADEYRQKGNGAPPYSNPNPARVGQVEEFFARACFEADQRLKEPAGCRWFLNWADDTPRDEFRRELLAEVERSLAERSGVPA